jgi:hypothetical protein
MAGCVDALLSDPAVTGLSGHFNTEFVYGRIDSTFFYPAKSGVTVYFDPNYPRKIPFAAEGGFLFDPGPGSHPGDEKEWIRPDMYSISPELLAEMKSETRGTTIMFISEGGFFVLVTLFGAYEK